MPLPTTSQLVEAWESALAQPTINRCVSLLPALGLVDPDQPVGEMAVGDCDWLLLQLRTELFGWKLETVATCPECEQMTEFELDGYALMTAFETDLPGPHDGRVVVTEGDRALDARLVTNADLVALSDLGRPVDAADLVKLCVPALAGQDGTAMLESLSEEALDRIASAIARADPGSSIQIEIRCPCSQVWSEEFDIRSYLWAELTAWVSRRLAEVHQLASSYGWSERAILSLSPSRRRAYVEACGW